MAKNKSKNTNAEQSAESAETVYVVASGNAFTHGGVMYDAGDKITESVFGNKNTFDALVEKGAIVKKEVTANGDGDAGTDNAGGANDDAKGEETNGNGDAGTDNAGGNADDAGNGEN